MWTLVAACLDADIRRLIEEGLLRWMPAHKSCAQAIRPRICNGEPVIMRGWRATRPADATTRNSARRSGVPRPAAARLHFAAEMLRIEAATLGAVTKAANRQRADVVTDGGRRTVVARSDSVRSPKTSTGQIPRFPFIGQIQCFGVQFLAAAKICVFSMCIIDLLLFLCVCSDLLTLAFNVRVCSLQCTREGASERQCSRFQREARGTW